MRHKNLTIKNSIILITIVFIVLVSGCTGKIKVFPDIDYSDDLQSLPVTQNPVTITNPSGEIRISLPLSEECSEHLTYLFIQKKISLSDDEILPFSALTVSLNELKNFKNDLIPITEKSNPNGLTNNEITEMNLSGNLPDIFLVRNNTYYSGIEDIYYDLSGEFFDSYINLNNLYPQMFYDLTSSGETFTIPFHAKVKMLYLNRDALQGSFVDPLLFDYPLTFNSVMLITEAVAESENNVNPWNSFHDLTLFLPGTIKPDYTNILNNTDINRYNFLNESYQSSLALIREFITKFTLDSYEESANSLFRIDYSDFPDTSIVNYEGISRYPVPVVDRISLPVSTINIAVNKNSEIAEFAKEFAIYLSLDEDALLFRSRFELPEGYIPPIKNPNIWERNVLRQKYGRDLFLIKDYMEYSFLVDPEYDSIIEDYSYLFNKYILDYLFSEEPLIQNIEDMNAEAKGLFNG